jgi:phosphoglycolate phosphatase-like HAD superfamily hydrolase
MRQHYDLYGKAIDERNQIEWSNLTYEVYKEARVTKSQLSDFARQIKVRPGAVEILRTILQAGHSIAIISFGIKDVIELMLSQHGLSDEISVYADKLQYNAAGVVIGADPNYPRVVGANKGDWGTNFLKVQGFQNGTPVVAAGDAIHDLHLVESVRNLNNDGIGLYYHHSGHKTGEFTYGALEEMIPIADIVSVNQHETDVSFRPVSDFIRRLIG